MTTAVRSPPDSNAKSAAASAYVHHAWISPASRKCLASRATDGWSRTCSAEAARWWNRRRSDTEIAPSTAWESSTCRKTYRPGAFSRSGPEASGRPHHADRRTRPHPRPLSAATRRPGPPTPPLQQLPGLVVEARETFERRVPHRRRYVEIVQRPAGPRPALATMSWRSRVSRTVSSSASGTPSACSCRYDANCSDTSSVFSIDPH